MQYLNGSKGNMKQCSAEPSTFSGVNFHTQRTVLWKTLWSYAMHWTYWVYIYREENTQEMQCTSQSSCGALLVWWIHPKSSYIANSTSDKIVDVTNFPWHSLCVNSIKEKDIHTGVEVPLLTQHSHCNNQQYCHKIFQIFSEISLHAISLLTVGLCLVEGGTRKIKNVI